MSTKKPFWNPYAAGIGLGLVLLMSFLVTGRGLGASGSLKRVQAAVVHEIDPDYAADNRNIGSIFIPGKNPLDHWIVFLTLGVALGGLVGALSVKRIKLETIHGPRFNKESRWILAVVGGIISGYAAQMARGCTSGQALTGGAQLALGSWVFMFSVFGGAYALAYFVRKQWI
ncbi:MAG: YeeE/YedE thiosulfate transporter family protein [Myxococcota bacterium]|nr:YeeE/YedE thiosulfate transporter family protein [Myxococcota bacterium]